MRLALPLIALAAVPLGACTMEGLGGSESPSARASLLDASGANKGSATLTQEAGGVRLRAEAMGLPAGTKGIHVHTTGTCTAPSFESAGPHWNPTSKQHGFDNPAGAHMGDLRSIEIGSDGRGRVDALLPNAQLTGGANPLMDSDGASVIIHAAADDYRTDPSGNSGGRVLCGTLSAG